MATALCDFGGCNLRDLNKTRSVRIVEYQSWRSHRKDYTECVPRIATERSQFSRPSGALKGTRDLQINTPSIPGAAASIAPFSKRQTGSRPARTQSSHSPRNIRGPQLNLRLEVSQSRAWVRRTVTYAFSAPVSPLPPLPKESPRLRRVQKDAPPVRDLPQKRRIGTACRQPHQVRDEPYGAELA